MCTDNLCIVGTDDGSGEGDYVNTSALLVFDRLTGKLLDSHYGLQGRYPLQRFPRPGF